MTSLLIWCSSHGKQLPSTHNKTLYFHMHISVSEVVIPLCWRASGCQSCTSCKEYINIYNSWLLPHITIQLLAPVAICMEHIILDCFTSHNHEKTSTNHITNLYWISSSAWPYQCYGLGNGYVFSLGSS